MFASLAFPFPCGCNSVGRLWEGMHWPVLPLLLPKPLVVREEVGGLGGGGPCPGAFLRGAPPPPSVGGASSLTRDSPSLLPGEAAQEENADE